MALTKIRGNQIQDYAIGNAHIDPTSPIVYSNLDLSHSLVATDLSTNHTVHTDVLDYKLLALWDIVQNKSVSGVSSTVTAEVQAAAVTDTVTFDGSAKGILSTGTGVNGAGIQNYKVQIRDALTKDPVADSVGGTVYGELRNDGTNYTIYFFESSGIEFNMGVNESFTIGLLDNTNNRLRGKYFVASNSTTKYAFRFINAGDTPEALPYNIVDVVIASGDNVNIVGTALSAAMNGGGFNTTYAGGIVSGTVSGVALQGITDGSGTSETGFTFNRVAKGTPSAIDFMFEEIYSLNTVPLKGFVTGVGFADIISTTGSHNHNDLYYSKSELESGQLDDRYATKTEISSGYLDTRYFTESELTDDGVLDARYYTETELGSTAEGSSGASRIGLSGVTGITAGSVQGAIAELQGDINDIVSGGINITHSLDDAYDDGGSITVDTHDIAINLSTAGRRFVVADATDTNKFVINQGSGADSISATTTGGIALSGANITLKDSNLAAAVPLSESGVAEISLNLTANSIVGAINETADDLHTLVTTTLPATTSGSSGATNIGVTGISGIIPTGGTLGGNGNLQAMLEGVALSAGGGKTYANIAAFTAAKASGEYFKLNEVVFILDVNRQVVVLTQGTTNAINVDWEYVGDTGNIVSGPDYNISVPTAQISGSEDVTLSSNGNTLTLSTAGIVATGSATDISTTDTTIASTTIDLNINSSSTAVALTDGQANIFSETITLTDIGEGGASVIVDNVDNAVYITSTTNTLTGINNFNGTNTLDGPLSVIAADTENISISKTGSGTFNIVSDSAININTPSIIGSGDLTLSSQAWLNVGNIKINSVDPDDFANITGSRNGTVNPANLLVNPGFEEGALSTITGWNQYEAIVDNTNSYYGNRSVRFYNFTTAAGSTDLIGQNITGLSLVPHILSFYAKGDVYDLEISLNGTTVPFTREQTSLSTWSRFSVVITPTTADGELLISLPINSYIGGFLDAIMLSEGETLLPYFTTHRSELQFTIGNEDNDRIVFRSIGTSAKDLVRINQADVEILGNLVVSGTTTTVNSEDLLVADNQIVLNSNVTGSPSLDAYFRVNRGSETDTAIRWNESNDSWEITNDGTNYSSIVTGSGTGGLGLTLDSAYDGGSSVSVDSTNVVWNLGTGRSFVVADATDTNKFVVSQGSGADSISIDTTGGITANADGAITLYSGILNGISIATDIFATTTGTLFLESAGQARITSASTDIDAIMLSSAGGIDINAGNASPITIDAGSFSLGSLSASNITVSNADLTISTAGTGYLNLSGGDGIVVTGRTDFNNIGTFIGGLVQTGGELTLNANQASTVNATNADLVVSTTTSGQLTVSSAGELLLQDARAGFNFTDVANTTLPGSATSIIGAINAAYTAAEENANTFDEVYDSETGTRAVTVDNGSVVFNLTDTYEFNINDVSAANILSVKALSTGDTVSITGAASITGTLTTSGNLTVNGAITTVNDIVGTGSVNLTDGTHYIRLDDTVSILGSATTISSDSTVSVSGATGATISTTTSGNISLTSVGEIYFDDSRTSTIAFSDVSNTSLPGGATSIVGAINAAYNNVGTITEKSYQEVIANTTDAANDYILVSENLLPTTGTFPMSPSALRALTNQVHAVVYLNGLRLSDTEWRYTYSGGEKRITFDGSNNISLVVGDVIMVDITRVIAN